MLQTSDNGLIFILYRSKIRQYNYLTFNVRPPDFDVSYPIVLTYVS